MRTTIDQKNRYSLNLESDVGSIYSVGDTLSSRLNRLSIYTIKDLLLHFPFRYDDLSQVAPLVEAKPGTSATFKVIVKSINNRRTKNGRLMTGVEVSDDSSTLKVIFFNQPYLINIIRPGDSLVLAGRVDYKPYFGRFMANPTFDKSFSANSAHLGRIVPVYPETRGITSKRLRQLIRPILKYSRLFDDYLPRKIREQLDLINLDEAIRQIHFPEYHDSLRAAIKRLAFDELFLIAMRSALIKNKNSSQISAPIKFYEKEIKQFVKLLPFKLTDAQRRATWEIITDLGRTQTMNRLLNGDVGSGKTIVAAISSLAVVLNKKQVVIMAPTEVLALQHYQNFVKLFGHFNLETELLTASHHQSSKRQDLSKLTDNSLSSDIIIGTHALIQEGIKFNDLGLVVIDEQHRFGVKQRAKIRENNLNHKTPHFLSMTATPIPRTLSLALYGDLDISILDEYPKGRQKIKTCIVPPSKRKKAYDFIKLEVNKGRQAFVICPLIEKKDKSQNYLDFDNRRAAISEYEKLSTEIFTNLKIGLLHGKLKSKQKEKVMRQFRNKKLDILVSTSVIEVGVDIPNATIMFIEGSERFGLSQLHQFRGRVGRGKNQSYCFLFAGSWSDKVRERLAVMAHTNDGFKLAEADLKMRGPGEIYGTRQHGLDELRFASLFDIRLINRAKIWAEKIVNDNPRLNKWPKLKSRLKSFEKNIHLE